MEGAGGSRGTRAGRKVKVRRSRQAREDFSSTLHCHQRRQAAIYEAKDFPRTKPGMLLQTLAKECSGARRVQRMSSKTSSTSKDSNLKNGTHQSYYYGTQSTVNEPQNLMTLPKGVLQQANGRTKLNESQNSMNLPDGVSLQAHGKPYRGTRAGKHMKMKHNFKKVSMLLSALSEECSKN